MVDDNDILIEDDIVKAIYINGCVSVITAVLVDIAGFFRKITLNKINFKIKTRSGETHEVCWGEDFLQVKKSSTVSDP